MTKDNRKLPPMKALAISCVCGLLAGVVLTAWLSVLSSWQNVKGLGITKANFDLIVEGMTREDVEKIFGCPPGDYSNGQAMIGGNIKQAPPDWIGYGGTIWVQFSEDGKVIQKQYRETYIFKRTWLERIKRIFGR